ncbi:MAG: sigma-70 family RNA polymerase sigma factor [Nitrospiraceae bacterium]
MAALQAKARFTGQSSERTWMIGILKHKMVDAFRKTTREPIQHADQSTDESPDEGTFVADGHWKPGTTAPSGWPDHPDSLLERKQFWEALTACIGKLPPRTAQVFPLREIDEVEADDICQRLCLTPSNLWVILHRARKQLRQCLDRRYFGQAQGMVE